MFILYELENSSIGPDRAGQPHRYIREVKRIHSVPYGDKLGFYLYGDKCWIVTSTGYFETDAEDFRHKLYMMSIPALSEKELKDLENKILDNRHTYDEVKTYNYAIRREKLHVCGGWHKTFYGIELMPSSFNKRIHWS